MNEEEEDKFLKENPVVFKKFKVKRKLGEGAFGEVYLGQTVEKNEYVALKVEPKKIAKPILQNEAFTLYNLAGPGIPAVKSFGKVKNYNVLVEPLLGKSLFDIFAENHKEMPMEDICLIAQQVLDRIQWVHSKFIVHRDIKPDNFLIGKKDPNVIYLIDFGLSQKYRSGLSGKHIRFGFTGKLTGTVRFASANALRGGEQSRRDDIESIGYMLVYFMKKRLPWQGVTGTRKMERYLKIYKMKKNTTPEELCKNLPDEMVEYIKYAKKLEFEQEPNYNYLRKLFKSILKRIHTTKDQLVFSWIKLQDIPNLKNPINPSSRRESPQSRIYKKIKNSLEKERNMSSDSNDSRGSYQQVYSQANRPNIKKVNITNIPDSEIEQEQTKKINKKKLKAREELNTMIANLDTFVDENAVDFENEVLLRGSKDIGENTFSKNTFGSNVNPNSNNLIKKNKNLINNFLENLEMNNDIRNDKDNFDKTKNKNEEEISNKDIINDINNKNEDIKRDEIKKDDNNIMDINNDINDNTNNKIENNVNNLNKNNKQNSLLQNVPDNTKNNNNNNNKKNNINPIFDSINNMIFQENNDEIINQMYNINDKNINKKEEKNDINKINEEPNEDKEKNNNDNKVSLKISNLEGKEFTFNESLNFKSEFKFNKQMKEMIPESQENVLSADKINNNNNNNYQKYFGNNKQPNNFNLLDNINNNNLNNLNNQNIQVFPENNQLILNNQNNKINAKKITKPILDKNKNLVNNNLNNINKMKLNQNMKIRKVNPPMKRGISELNNENYQKTFQVNNFTDLNNMNNINFPNDNDTNDNYKHNDGILDINQKIKKVAINKLNNNINNNINQNKTKNKKVIKLVEPMNMNNNNAKSEYNDLTFERNNNPIPFDGLINMPNNKNISPKGIKKKKAINNNINMRPMGEKEMNSNQNNNMGNNITNININIRNNYVQNNENNNMMKKKNNMNIKVHPNMVTNKIVGKLQNNINLNQINLNPNLKKYSPRNQNRFQPRIIGNTNPTMNNLYPNTQRIINYPTNLPKNNNLNIMINNPNQIKNMNMNMNIKNLNNNYNMNSIKPIQFQTNPNELNNKYPNSVKNNYAIQYTNKLGGNMINMPIRNNNLNNNMINQNINYGIKMTPKIQMNNYTNINPNLGIKYNNTLSNVNNIQNLNANNLNYPIYQYQPKFL